MNKKENLERFSVLLREEEEDVRKSSPGETRVALIELARAFDMGIMTALSRERGEGDSGDLLELYDHGWSKALSLFLDDSTNKFGIPIFKSDERIHQWAHTALQYCGRISLCELLLDYEKHGLFRLIDSEESRCVIQPVSKQIGLESLERQDFHWLQGFTKQMNAPKFAELESQQVAIDGLMEELVAPWHEHFMQYRTTPQIDMHYEKLGVLAAQNLFGQESFPGDACFGGEPFNLYRATVGLLIGWALKHEGFCRALMRKSKTAKPRNFLVDFTETKDLVAWVSASLHVGELQAKKALDVLTLSTENVSHFRKLLSAPPPLIAIGSNYLLKTFFGQVGAPFFFMLRELRRRFPSDWDRAVDAREAQFREDVYTIFGHPRLEKVLRPVKIRDNGRVVSDLDAVVFDPAAKIAGLFQLKWQDAFGSSMRERASRMSNFTREAEKWVVSVSEWIRGKSMQEVGRLIGLSPESAKSLDGVVLFVIGRNFSHFSGGRVYDERAAWGNWAQLLRLTQESPKEFIESPVKWMHDKLKHDSPHLRQPMVFGSRQLKLRRLEIIVVPPVDE